MPRLRFDFPDSPAVELRDPVRVIEARSLAEVRPALAAVEQATADGLHAAGFVAYEAAPAFDPPMVTRNPGPLPLLWFGCFDAPTPAGPGPTPWSGPLELDLGLTREEHAAAVREIREAIVEGRTYQVNLTARLETAFSGDPEALYHRLRKAQGPGYHAFIDLGRHAIVSASPELFFRVRGRDIETRPMKGTRPRGRWTEEDRTLRAALAASPKDRAENLMIVDLLRNDLGRVCAPGGVRVPDLWAIEAYRTVWQMTSTVTGRLRDDVGLADLFTALFPCGSVTGAPKISTMELIAELESSPREVYCGAIGWVRPGGDCTFNVPIRTAWVDRDAGRVRYGAGGGIVWDSTPEEEYDELVAKTVVVRETWPSFELLETIGLRDGEPLRLDRHLARLEASAERFGFPFPEAELRAAVADAADGAPAWPAALRLTLAEDGRIRTGTRALDRVGGTDPDAAAADAADGTSRGRTEALPRVALADRPIDRGNPFYYHKTTHRRMYEEARSAHPDAFDVLLWNEDGELTEFCRGNVVVELDGRRVTPPVAAGLLAGVGRGEALEAGLVTEATVRRQDLERADAIWFLNSARGWIRVQP